MEDNADVLEFNRFLLEKQGFVVETANNLAAAREIAATCMPDAVVLDIGLPDGNGLELLTEIRLGKIKSSALDYELSKVPVLVLTGYGKDNDVVRGFKLGCDDYLSKPYTFEVLLARLTRILQGAEKVSERVIYGALELDMLGGKAFLHDTDLLLTQREFALLLILARNAGQTQSADYLYEKIWGQPMNDNKSALKNMIYRVRKKIKGSGYDILAERGQGYVFDVG